MSGAGAIDLGPDDLVMSWFGHDPTPLDQRVPAAAAAGFTGIGLHLGEWLRLGASNGAADECRDLLAEHDIVIAELEALRGFGYEGRTDDLAARLETAAYEAADALGARYLQVIGPYDGTPADAAAQFGALCDRAADHGLLVGIEFLPFTNIATAGDAAEIVERCGRDNAGGCVDIWHHERGASDMQLIRDLPADRIYSVQLSDGPLVPVDGDHYDDDCLTNRLAPGEGEFDIAGFIRELDANGSTAPLSMEICSTRLWERPIEEAAVTIASAIRDILADARPAAGIERH
ncbi:MAG: sugar phosphate isomerase/epimerase [Acidimicrobiia bacterium]|nr:sugar phosphate isomerase/epimerase [Acidimicrobiia bacterium]